jgi:peptide/nickel transport system permease protein
MIKFILRRLLVLPVIMFVVTSLLFLLMLQLPPEQRVMVYLPSVSSRLTEEQFQELIQITIDRYGLNQPFLVQYENWIKKLVTGDWGYSPAWRQPVAEGIRQRAPATLELLLFATIPSVILAISLGSLAARYKNRLPDHLVRASAFLVWAFPPFILALILMNIFYAWLGWFPPERISIWAGPVIDSSTFRTFTGLLTIDALLNGNLDIFWDALRHLVLPASLLALTAWALLSRVMRSSLIDVLEQDYITAARAKGLREPEVVNRHARRNALLPVISTGSVVVSMLMSWMVVIETVFHFNGVGRWAVTAILNSDLPVAVGFAVFSCAIVVVSSLLADILYAVVDPRIRLY